MRELYRHIGADTDVPAGDIGVGGREIGYLYGYYKKLENVHTGVLTGKGLDFGGSLIRPEATGYGAVYFAVEMLAMQKKDIKGKVAAVSASGNVAQYTVQKLQQLGAKAISLSDSDGTIIDEAGISPEKLAYVMELKNVRRGRIKEYAEKYNVPYFADKCVWDVIKDKSLKVDLAFPSAHENEIDGEQADALMKNGCSLVSEGANMPSTPEAQEIYIDKGILYGPAKAANAGGVATSGLEMSQNSLRLSWTREEVDMRLQGIMKAIHTQCVEAAKTYGEPGNYIAGANLAGFLKVARSMLAYGIV
jgi:glutamate dehydrogenase (NADP+)